MTDRNLSEENVVEALGRLHEGTLREDGDHCDSGECWCWEDRYMVVTRETIKQLCEAVNAFIHQQGWKPIGGISAESERLWAQTMVRHV